MDKRPIDIALAWARDCDWSDAELARRLDVEQQSIVNWRKRGLPPKRLKAVAKLFGRSVDELLGNQQQSAQRRDTQEQNYEPAVSRAKVPLISWIRAGMFNEVDDQFHPGDAEEWIDVRAANTGPRAFALRILGPSMTSPYGVEPSFPEGCVVVIDPDRAPTPGAFVVAKDVQTQGATFKRLAFDGGRWYLQPLNPSFPTIEIDDPDLRVIGVAVEMSMTRKL